MYSFFFVYQKGLFNHSFLKANVKKQIRKKGLFLKGAGWVVLQFIRESTLWAGYLTTPLQ
jgi:predicted nucleic acid-binding Zn ribbon protein